MLLTPKILTVVLLIPIILSLAWIVIYSYYIKKRFSIASFIPLAIVLLFFFVVGKCFLSKIYIIEPDGGHQRLYVMGNYELKILEDDQVVSVKNSDKEKIVIVNTTTFKIKYYGISYGDIEPPQTVPAKIPAHSYYKSEITPDIFPNNLIPDRILRDEDQKGYILNVLQFDEQDSLLPQ